MNTLQKSVPSSIRTGSVDSRAPQATRGTEPRPYLVPVQQRRSGAPQQRTLPLFPHESEDARLTGTTRSLYRRLLALNLPAEGQRIPVVSEKHTETILTGTRIRQH
jgi:hypothetical protein